MFAFWQCAALAFLLAFRAPVLGGAESGHGHGHVEDAHEHHGHPGHGGHGAHGAHGAHDEGHQAHGHASQAATATNRWSEPIDWRLGAYGSAILMCVLSFVGVVSVIPLRIQRIRAMVEYVSLTFAATVLVADAFIHLLPHALEGADHESMTAVGIAATLGCLSILTIPGMVEWHHRGHHGHEVHAYGIANLATEVMHNFVDGIALGIAWRTSTAAGIPVTLAVAVHELPQEIGDFIVLRTAGFAVGQLLWWNFVASLSCVGGVALVHVVGQTDLAATVQRYATAFTAGSFLTLALNMIFPQVMETIRNNHRGGEAVRANALCSVISMFAMYVLLRIGDLEVGHDGHSHGGHGHGHEL